MSVFSQIFNKRAIIYQQLIMSFLLVSLLGCGGGGSETVTNTRIGQFIDGPVSGLRFVTETHSGKTNSEGEFEYEPGETIRFYIGDILLGEALAEDTVTPFSLAGILPPVESKEISDAEYRDDYYGDIYSFSEYFESYSPLDRVTNIAVFLQTLDSDSNHSNGIQISDRINTLATGQHVNFNRRAFSFLKDNFSFRQLLARGRSEGLWGGSRDVVNPAIALDQLYQKLGLNPKIYNLARRDFDRDNDGTPNTTILYTYNEAGLEARFEKGNRVTTTTYDSNAHVIQTEYDEAPFGSINERLIYEYDANGYRTKEKTDENADGLFEKIIISTYDDYGNLIEMKIDNSPLGSIDEIKTSEFNNNGDITLFTTDMAPIGSINKRREYTYNGNKQLTKIKIDNEADGIVDSTITYSYTSTGKIKQQDSLFDGILTYHYQSEAPFKVSSIDIDSDRDTLIDAQIIYSFNEQGQKIRVDVDSSPLGSINDVTKIIYTDAGSIAQVIKDTDNDGTPNETVKYQYDSNDNLILEETYLDNNSEAASSISSEFSLTNRWGRNFGSISTQTFF